MPLTPVLFDGQLHMVEAATMLPPGAMLSLSYLSLQFVDLKKIYLCHYPYTY